MPRLSKSKSRDFKRAVRLTDESGFGGHNNELFVVVAVLGVLLAVFIPQFLEYQERKEKALGVELSWYDGIVPVLGGLLAVAFVAWALGILFEKAVDALDDYKTVRKLRKALLKLPAEEADAVIGEYCLSGRELQRAVKSVLRSHKRFPVNEIEGDHVRFVKRGRRIVAIELKGDAERELEQFDSLEDAAEGVRREYFEFRSGGLLF